MNKVIEVAENKDAIIKTPRIYCNECGEDYYSEFDKLYIKAFGKCVSCTPDDAEIEHNSNQIFQIM